MAESVHPDIIYISTFSRNYSIVSHHLASSQNTAANPNPREPPSPNASSIPPRFRTSSRIYNTS